MIETTIKVLLFVLAVYFGIGIILAIIFGIKGFNVTITNYNTDTKYEIKGYKKYLSLLLLCVVWPMVITFDNE